jgi:hypothetical protein
MKFEKYLNEKFFNAFQHRGETKEIFVNPSKRELRELFRDAGNYVSVGFICDLIDDKIYFFLRALIIHQDAFDHIKPGVKLYKDSRYLTGQFQVYNGVIKDVDFESFRFFSDSQVIKEALDSDWSYFDKWIPNINKELHKFFSTWKKQNKKFLEAS